MNRSTEYVFLAGGIGITPFRSIINHHLTIKKTLSATLFHFAVSQEELLFREMFEMAVAQIGITFLPVLYDKSDTAWPGLTGRFSEKMLTAHIADVQKPTYFISGSDSFINSVQTILQSMDISEERIKTDIFSGY